MTRYRKYRKRYKRKYRYRSKRRRTYKRRRRGPTLSVMRMPAMMPDRVMVKLKYMENRASANSTGLAITHTYAINSLFDPDNSGVGHQPRGFDQWGAFYAWYKVHACKVKFKFLNNGTEPVNVGAVFSPNGNINLVYPSDCYEQTYGWCTILPAQGSNNRVTYTRYMPVSKLSGDRTLGDEYEAPISANPATMVFVKTFVRDSKGTTNTVDVEHDDVLIFFTEFYGRQPVASS